MTKKPAKPKDKHLNVRIDEDLYEEAQEQAKPYGGLSAVVRAFLKIFASGERVFTVDDVAEANTRAPRVIGRKKKGEQAEDEPPPEE